MLTALFVLVLWMSLSSVFKAKQTVPSIAIPRGKSRKSVTIGFGQGIVNKIFREIKISFCSELEALTLQLTRPTDIALAASSLDEIIKFLDDEYDNASLLTSVLIKLSRKFMEPNSYTKLKAMLIVHKILLSISKEKKSFKIVQALEALRKETDEKFDMSFFSAESLENVVGSADTVAEATAVDLAIAYSKYVLDFIDYKAYMRSFPTTTTTPEEGDVVAMEATAKLLCNQIQRGIEVDEACVNCDRSSELAKQCGEAQEADRDILKIELKALYEKMVRFSGVDSKAKLSPSAIKDIEATLKIVDPSFAPFKLPATATTTVTATATATAVRKSVEVPVAAEESKKQQVEEVEVKTTKKKKEKVTETSIANQSKGSAVEESSATATATAIKSSTENARTSEIARDLAQRSVSRSSGSGSGSGSSATTPKKSITSSTSVQSSPAAPSLSTTKQKESTITSFPKTTKKATSSATKAAVEQKSQEDRKDTKITPTKSRTVDSGKASKQGASSTSAQNSSKSRSNNSSSSTGSNNKKKGSKKK